MSERFSNRDFDEIANNSGIDFDLTPLEQTALDNADKRRPSLDQNEIIRNLRDKHQRERTEAGIEKYIVDQFSLEDMDKYDKITTQLVRNIENNGAPELNKVVVSLVAKGHGLDKETGQSRSVTRLRSILMYKAPFINPSETLEKGRVLDDGDVDLVRSQVAEFDALIEQGDLPRAAFTLEDVPDPTAGMTYGGAKKAVDSAE